ncbi:MAG: gamma-glutamyl-gamma-aminobutyrate hydrolase family protein, partial [Patescibacteria group bacterium]
VISRTGESPKMLSPTPFVSVTQPVLYNQHYQKKVILVDCGLKLSILRELLKLPVAVKRVPFDYDYTHEAFDGVVVSNGPGDPESYRATITILRKALRVGKPIFGICLGSQLLALAAGAKTYKLPFGHRGHNQPCLSTVSGQGYITSQNHGYAVDEKSLPQGWNVTFRNLNDDSVEGITHAQRPFFSVQFHPEARPGPTDTAWLFQEFYQKI